MHTTKHQDGRPSILGLATEDFTSIIGSSKWNGNTQKFGHCIETELSSYCRFLTGTSIECKQLGFLSEILVAFEICWK